MLLSFGMYKKSRVASLIQVVVLITLCLMTYRDTGSIASILIMAIVASFATAGTIALVVYHRQKNRFESA